MFKGFQSKSRQFNGFPNLNFQTNNEAFGFSGWYWLQDAEYGLNTSVNLDPVTRWQSKIGYYIFSQSTAANQPRLILNDSDFNNYPSVDFSVDRNRALQTLNAASIDMYNPGSTFVFVYKLALVNNMNNILSFNAITNQNIVGGGTLSHITGFGLTTSVNAQFLSTIEDAAKHLAIIICNKTNSEIIIDGVSVATGSISISQSFNLLGGVIGTNMNGKIAFAGSLNRSMSSVDAIELSSRINLKYGIY
jgi:hypothetical protein